MSITREKRKMRNQIGDIDIYYLEHGTVEGGPAHDDFELFLRTDEEWEKIWQDQREKAMESWVREYPCTRCWAFWQYDAKEPRARIGGKGQTPWDAGLAIAPSYSFGLPTTWISEFEMRHFKNLKGVAIDFNDLYESETSYLLRHHLLSPQEKRFLASHPELTEPEKISNE